jgi:hypothetical protein
VVMQRLPRQPLLFLRETNKKAASEEAAFQA